MTEENFCHVLEKIRGKSKYLYLHLMGEPFLHPLLAQFCTLAQDAGFEVMLTSNGTLLSQKGEFVFRDKSVKKISISLQAAEFSGENAQIGGEILKNTLPILPILQKNAAKTALSAYFGFGILKTALTTTAKLLKSFIAFSPTNG